jgi:hypothetical protein
VDRENEAEISGTIEETIMKGEAAAKDMAEDPRDTDAVSEAAVFPPLGSPTIELFVQ